MEVKKYNPFIVVNKYKPKAKFKPLPKPKAKPKPMTMSRIEARGFISRE